LINQMAASPAPVEDHGRTGFRYLLGNRDFRLVWHAQVAAQLADKFLMFSLIILAYRLSRGSTPVAITLLAYTVPAVAIAPLAGVVADRYDRKMIMVATNLGRGVLVALIPLSALVPWLQHDYIHLLALTFLFAAVGQLFSPAEAAAIPTVVSRDALITANSMVLATMVITLVVGAALAPIVSRLDLFAPYWIAVALFGSAGVLIAFARIPRVERAGPATERHPFEQLDRWVRWFGVGFSFLLGLEFGAMMIPALSYLMEHTSDSVRGRIFSLLFMVVNGATALPVLLTAALSDVVGTNWVIATLGVLLAATGLLTARYAGRVFGEARAQR